MPAVSRVLIVGGGISGMTLAIGLQRASIYSEIVEVSPQWTVPGVGITLQGAALRALKTIGVLDECVELGFGYSHFKACGADGNITGTVKLPRLVGADYPATIGIMRQALHSVLQDALAAARVPVHLGVTIFALDQRGDGVDVKFTNGAGGAYDLVVGADGSNSTLRDLVFGTDCRPIYTEQAVWRATVRRPREVQARHSYYGPRSKAGINPVSDTQMYVYLVQNVPEFVRIPDDQLPQVLREQLEDFGGLLGSARDTIDDPSAILYRPINSHILPSPWYRGRAILIGDAAHTATPHMAAGAGIAIEDSVVLASLLDSEQSLPHALESFMTRRFERCRMVVENSFQLGEWEKNPNAPDADPVGILERSYNALAQPI
jgi:2-polyprenyl-6-methoxyphenol hydroxylase-like FAD-dependent oxidoreductase